MSPLYQERGGRTRTRRGLALREGGWVLIMTGAFLLGLIIWAIAPAIIRKANAPPGDGQNIDSYGFDLSNLAVDRSLVAAALMHRDMLPRWDFPPTYAGRDILQVNAEQRGKYIVTTDRVIGIVIDGEARAYPISVMNVHEIINDRIGDTDIAVTYNWHCDSPRVYVRTLSDGATPTFGHSGLFYNSNTLLYDEPVATGAENTAATPTASLWCQFTGRCIAGPRLGQELSPVFCQYTNWATWLEEHPDTRVIQPDANLRRRYQSASPDAYFLAPELSFPASPLPPSGGRTLKERVVAVTTDSALPVVFSVDELLAPPEGESMQRTVGPVTIHVRPDATTHTAYFTWQPSDADVRIEHSLWFAWHAFHGETGDGAP
jgi:hypothetical protein